MSIPKFFRTFAKNSAMLKYIIPILILCAVCSCGSKGSTSENDVNAVENIEFTPVESSSYQQRDSYNLSSEGTNQPITPSRDEKANSNGGGYQYGYDMGYIAGENNMEYNPYLPNTASYPMSYRQEYCRGYDAGYQAGQQAAGRPSDHVNTGDEPEDTYIEYNDDEDY